METTSEATQILDEIYYICGHNNIILDAYNNRAKAVKEFILRFKGRTPYYHLIVIIRGIQYDILPSGSIADYVKTAH
jgi:hypothetical protein